MKRLAVLILVGAVLVGAQNTVTNRTATINEVEMEKIQAQFQERLKTEMENVGGKVDLAKEYALKYQKELEGKTPEERQQIMEQRRKEAQERLQKAIEDLEKASENVGAQIEEVKERIQKRLLEKKEDLIQLQARILSREEARKNSGDCGYGGVGGIPPVENPETGGVKAGEGKR